ncbi:MAG: MotA/TolQ/ExbB proton channel family protein [Solobacterium sp.]|nr:MotA/TolQ/ExbB proton channel family protein [Solobacterium sp.]
MLAISHILANILNPVIFMVGIFEAYLGSVSGYLIYGVQSKLKKLIHQDTFHSDTPVKDSHTQVKREFHSMNVKDYHKDLDPLRNDYEKAAKKYSRFSLLIQIFPLLGILGTVAGLHVAISEGQEIYAGVEFALTSTILGLIFAILFKFFDVLLFAPWVNEIEDGFDRYEKEFLVDSREAV